MLLANRITCISECAPGKRAIRGGRPLIDSTCTQTDRGQENLAHAFPDRNNY